jgi:hypothetical protein
VPSPPCCCFLHLLDGGCYPLFSVIRTHGNHEHEVVIQLQGVRNE